MWLAIASRSLPQQWLDSIPAHRFYEVMVKSGSLGAAPIELLPPAGLGYEEHSPAPGRGPDPARDLVTVQARHTQIDQCDMRPELFRRYQALLPVIGNLDVVARGLDEHSQAISIVPEVVNDQDAALFYRRGVGGRRR